MTKSGSSPNTGGNLNCLKKHVQDIFFTWFHMHKILKCPKIEHFQFLSLFCSKSHHVSKFWNAQFSIYSYSKIGLFERSENWASVRFLSISKFYAYEITWKIYLSHAFWGISNYLPYTRTQCWEGARDVITMLVVMVITYLFLP